MSDTTFVSRVTPINAEWLNDVNSSVYRGKQPSGTLNSSVDLYNQGGILATTRTVANKLQESVSVKDFGAVGDGVTDDTTAFLNAISALSTGGSIYVPTGNYIISSSLTITVPGILFVGDNCYVSKLTKKFSGDLFTISTGYFELKNIYLEGNGGIYTGRNININNDTTPNITISDCQLLNSQGPCVEFTVATAGSYFTMSNTRIFRYNPALPAVKTPNDGGLATPRRFYECHSDGAVFADFSGADNTQVIGGNFGGTAVGQTIPIITDTNTNKLQIIGVRFNNGGGSTTFNGKDGCVVDVVSAGDIIVGSLADNINITGCSAPNFTIQAGAVRYTLVGLRLPAGGLITDNALDQQSYVEYNTTPTAFTPGWTGSITNPVLGNGTLTGSWYRRQNSYIVFIEVTIGSTTTLGSGDWRFNLNFNSFVRSGGALNKAVGIAHIRANGSYQVGAAVCPPGLSYITIYTHGTTNVLGATVPGTWIASDRIWLEIEIPIY